MPTRRRRRPSLHRACPPSLLLLLPPPLPLLLCAQGRRWRRQALGGGLHPGPAQESPEDPPGPVLVLRGGGGVGGAGWVGGVGWGGEDQSAPDFGGRQTAPGTSSAGGTAEPPQQAFPDYNYHFLRLVLSPQRSAKRKALGPRLHALCEWECPEMSLAGQMSSRWGGVRVRATRWGSGEAARPG